MRYQWITADTFRSVFTCVVYTVQVKLYSHAGAPTQGYNRDAFRRLGINCREHSPLKTLYQKQHKAGFADYSSRSRAGGRGNKIKIQRFGRSKKMKMVMVVRRKGRGGGKTTSWIVKETETDLWCLQLVTNVVVYRWWRIRWHSEQHESHTRFPSVSFKKKYFFNLTLSIPPNSHAHMPFL